MESSSSGEQPFDPKSDKLEVYKRRPFVIISCAMVMLTVLILLIFIEVPVSHSVYHDDKLYVVRAYFEEFQLVEDLVNWKEPWEVNIEEGYVVVDATVDEYDRLKEIGFRLEIDIGLTSEYNKPRGLLPGQIDGIPGYPCYRTVEETYSTAEQLTIDYPQLATWIDIGDSWDKLTPGGPAGYDLLALRLTNDTISDTKPKLFVFGSIHAREYAAAELATRFAEYLLTNYNVNPDVTWLLDYHEIHMVLQANPDGRKKAETGILWRKTTDNSNGCSASSPPNNYYGVDLNRNFQFYWNSGGSSGDACDDLYRGSSAVSEPETLAYQSHGISIFPDQRDDILTAAAPVTSTGIFLDLHSYGQEILWSWGFTSTAPANNSGIQTLARKMGYFSGYAPTQSLYTTSGTTKDFFYGELGVPGYTIELGTTFFQSCSYFENSILPDNIPSLLYAAKAARFSYITPAGPDTVDISLSSTGVLPGEQIDIGATINDTRYENGQGSEPYENIAAADFYIDVPPWVTSTTPISLPMTPIDGIFDSPMEAVQGTIDTTGLESGRHMIFVRGQDAVGNWGAISAAFVEIGTMSAPVAAFTSSTPDRLGATTAFTSTSTGGSLSYQWDFGDGSPSSNVANPTHLYEFAGAYTVTLTATNNLGLDVAVGTVEITQPQLFLPLAQSYIADDLIRPSD